MTLATSHRRRGLLAPPLVVLAVAAVLLVPRTPGADGPAGPQAGAWAADPLWDDGNAEVATYRATQTIYGKERVHTATLITVKEDFNTDYQVKADWPYGDKPVLTMLKTNLAEDIATENYPYRSLTSVYVARDAPLQGHKVSYGLHEWCGNTFKELRQYDEPDGARLVFHTYWDGQGSGEVALDAAAMAAVPEEQLLLYVRALDLRDGATAPITLLSSLRGSQFHGIAARPATLVVARGAERDVGGARVGVWSVAITPEGEGPMHFEVADNPGRTLLSADFGDGRTYRLESVRRSQYWVR